jgi:hypothetical protein
MRATTDRGVRGNSGLPESALIVVGNDHQLADEEPLQRILETYERLLEPSTL